MLQALADYRVVGVANKRSIAWGIAQALAKVLRVGGVQGQAPWQPHQGGWRFQDGGVNAVHRCVGLFGSSMPAG